MASIWVLSMTIIITEKNALESKEENFQKMNVFALFRYADKLDVFLLISSSLAAIVAGLLVPGKF